MSNLEEYFALVKKHPQLFVNPPGGEIALLLDEGEIREVEAQMRQWLELKGLPDEWAEVGIAYPDTGASSECNEFFYAEITSYGNMDTNEGISELRIVTVPEFESLIRENTINDEFTIVAYARAKLQGLL